MELVRWNPWREMSARNRANVIFNEFFFPAGVQASTNTISNWNPSVDVHENDDHFVIKADLPGIDKKDIALDVKDGVLTLKGERHLDEEVKKENTHFRERVFGRFVRAFKLPEHIDADKITADHANGVLKIEIPKPEAAKPRQITVH
jgi:HSP20 family protein